MIVASNTVGSPRPLRHPPRERPRIVVLIAATTLCWSCGGGVTDVAGDTAGREAFIGAYLDLRTATLSSGTPGLSDEVRDSILAAYDVTGQDLIDFIDTHGEDVEFMRDLWTEIEVGITERLEPNADDEETEDTGGAENTDGAGELPGGDATVSP